MERPVPVEDPGLLVAVVAAVPGGLLVGGGRTPPVEVGGVVGVGVATAAEDVASGSASTDAAGSAVAVCPGSDGSAV